MHSPVGQVSMTEISLKFLSILTFVESDGADGFLMKTVLKFFERRGNQLLLVSHMTEGYGSQVKVGK